MAKLVFGAALLFAVVNVSLPVYAEDQPSPSVTLKVCNPGKVDIDVLVAKANPVATTRIAPNTCAPAYSEKAAVPAYVGFAFADSRGQWGTPHRLDLIPDFGLHVLARSDKNVTIRRGSQDVPAQLQLSFQPPNPTCQQYQRGGPSGPQYSEVDSLPWNASASQRAVAGNNDARRAANRAPDLPLETRTFCDTFVYTLNVVAYSEIGELSFEKECVKCPSDVKPLSRKQQAAAWQNYVMISAVSPTSGAVANHASQPVLPPQLQNWPDFSVALARTAQSGGLPQGIPKNIVIRGTVSRIVEAPANASEHWVDVFLNESPDGRFDVCALSPDIFQDVFGKDFRTSMIGQAIEVEGEIQRAYCKGYKGSIRVTLSHQLHKTDAAQLAVALTAAPSATTATPEQLKSAACIQQARKDHPGGGLPLTEEVGACMRAK